MGKPCDEDIPEASAEFVRLHGRTATAFRAMGDDLARWTAPPSIGTGVVGYVAVSGARVAAGEPIAAPEAVVAIAEAFMTDAQAAGLRASFFATEGRLAHSTRIQRRLIGEQPVWNPRHWPAHVAGHRSLREQIRRARAKGVRVLDVAPTQLLGPAWAPAINGLLRRWRATRSLASMAFLVTIDLVTQASQRRCWVALQDERVVALLALAPVASRDADGTGTGTGTASGWLFEHLLRDPDAPNGTAELLVDHAMRALAADGITWATLGLAPLQGPVDASLQRARRWSRPLFNFDGLSAFKRKLRPDVWEPIYLAWPAGGAGWRALLDGLRAFANGSLLRFGMHTYLRGPRVLLQVLAWLLVPWTTVLALAPTTPWFPSRLTHHAWIAFDVALIVALHVLSRRTASGGARSAHSRRRTARLAISLAAAVTADALLTLAQAYWFLDTTGHTLTEPSRAVLLVLVACAGPMATAPMLWGTARRLAVLTTPRPRVIFAEAATRTENL